MSIVTLTTDFGLNDSYVGTMKGVILGIAPGARIIDISHGISPQSVREAAYVLRNAVPFFPADTIHVVVVDPGVGSRRRPMAIRTTTAYFVGPDNGVFSFLWQEPPAPAVIELDNPGFWLPSISRTFHGRDIFSPAAAHLATGVPFAELGTAIHDPVLLPAQVPKRLADGSLSGHVVHRDTFGNLITDIPAPWLAAGRWLFSLSGHHIVGPSTSYSDADVGQLVSLVSSAGTLEIAVRNGSAADHLGVKPGEEIHARPYEP